MHWYFVRYLERYVHSLTCPFTNIIDAVDNKHMSKTEIVLWPSPFKQWNSRKGGGVYFLACSNALGFWSSNWPKYNVFILQSRRRERLHERGWKWVILNLSIDQRTFYFIWTSFQKETQSKLNNGDTDPADKKPWPWD